MFTILAQSLFGEQWHEVEDFSEGQWTFGKNFWWSFLTVGLYIFYTHTFKKAVLQSVLEVDLFS